VHWLNALCTGTRWPEMGRDEALYVMRELRRWVAEDLPWIKVDIAQSILSRVQSGQELSLRDFPLREELVPRTLVEKAGLSVKTPPV